MRDISTKAYAQWVVINITNSSKETVVFKNVRLSWGKFYFDGKSLVSSASVMAVLDIMYLDHATCIDDKDDEMPASDIENAYILPGKSFRVNSCGRSNASSGTEGSFDIEEEGGGEVRHFYWSCPWGGNTNTWTVSCTKYPPLVHSQPSSRGT